MPKSNVTNNRAKSSKYDEFFTLLPMIEKEMKFYKNKFREKIIYCNCDDASVSNFFKYFAYSFEYLGIKKLIATGYKKGGRGVYACYEGDKNGNKIVEKEEIVTKQLECDGDFRSEECIQLLKEADIIVTNPPFSLFREYIDILMKHKKKFLVIGNLNSATDKDIFHYIMDGQMWLGASMNGCQQSVFVVPEDYKDTNSRYMEINGQKCMTTIINTATWYTNLPHKKRNEPIDLYKKYTPEEYPKYDQYDAINVKKIAEIPEDYKGKMGVPISILGKLCPNQFELIGLDRYVKDNPRYGYRFTINNKETYPRVIIVNKSIQ